MPCTIKHIFLKCKAFNSTRKRYFQITNMKDLAAASALSFPLTPMWLGIQQKRISLFDMESSLQSSLMISGFSSFLLFNDNRTESESENIINFSCFSLEMMSSARSIAQASPVKIELSIHPYEWCSIFLERDWVIPKNIN